MYITVFQRKNVRGKKQWICESSKEYSDKTINWWVQDLSSNKPFEIYTFLERVRGVTENQVNLGSCKRPHHYIKF
jgi:hypothetical protein